MTRKRALSEPERSAETRGKKPTFSGSSTDAMDLSKLDKTVFESNGQTVSLVVGTQDNQRVLVVCPKSVSRASPVFETMLFGKFRESQANSSVVGEDWVVPLPEDDHDALVVIMNIAHTRFAQVPTKPTIDLLYRVTTTCHKYDMTSALSPWAKQWCKHWVFGENANPRLLWIALELGHANLFKHQLWVASSNTSVNPSSDELEWGEWGGRGVSGGHGVFDIDDHIVSMDLTGTLVPNPLTFRNAESDMALNRCSQGELSTGVQIHDTRLQRPTREDFAATC